MSAAIDMLFHFLFILGKRNRLGMLLVKLRTGLSHAVIATLFGVRKSSVTYNCRVAREALMTAFVPGNVGFEAVSRQSVIDDHTTTIARTLFADGEKDRAILVLDGTYIECEKPENHQFQVKTSLWKTSSLDLLIVWLPWIFPTVPYDP